MRNAGRPPDVPVEQPQRVQHTQGELLGMASHAFLVAGVAVLWCVAGGPVTLVFLVGAAAGFVAGIAVGMPKGVVHVGGYHELSSGFLNATKYTDWLSLGLWTGVDKSSPDAYAQACQALARRLGTKAALGEGDAVVDVGFGRGQQLLEWIHHFGVKSVHGVNISKNEVDYATQMIERSSHADKVQLLQGDATHLPFPRECFTKVLSLDSAYHYLPRTAYLREASRVVEPGGTYAAADIVSVAPVHLWSAHQKLAARALCRASGIPFENLWSVEEYTAALEEVGFTDVAVESIGVPVFEGFAEFISGAHYARWGDIVSPGVWLQYLLVGRLAALVSRRRALDFVIITATKAVSNGVAT